MDLIDGMKAFVATAEAGSFTAAASRLGISNRLASKYVAELEARLGVRLLQRTTRRVGLTPAGEELLARLPPLLDELDGLVSDMTETRRGFSGTLRVSAPVTFGESHLADMLSRFAAPHPDLVIDLRLDDTHVDLASDGIDLAFRIGETSARAVKVRRLAKMYSVLVCAPAYLEDRSAPGSPDDLVDHDCIVDTNRRSPTRWTFLDGPRATDVTVRGRFFVNSARVARDLALAGRGIAYCPTFVLGNELKEGRLVRLLPEFDSDSYPLSAVYLEGRELPRKVRALIDFAREDLASVGGRY